MKIGIITYHRAINYGAVLQAFAFKSAFEKLGHTADIIDYRNSKIEYLYKEVSFFTAKGVKNKLKYLLTCKNEGEKYNRFKGFRKDYLALDGDKKAVYKEDLKCLNDNYDLFVTGSDQVFNINGHDFDKAYFLDFVSDNLKKASYAASFGVSKIDDKYSEVYKELLSGFNNISVREEQGSKIINNLLGFDARVDVDPVFLLTKEEWNNKFNLQDNTQEKYALMYNFELTKVQIETAYKLYKMGYKIKYIGNPVKKLLPFECEYQRDCGPIDFLKLIYNASYVITNSFHGLSLSLNFNVKVLLEMRKEGKDVNSRLENIAHLLGLDNKVLNDISDIDKILNSEFDWASINEKIQNLRQNSIEYLNSLK